MIHTLLAAALLLYPGEDPRLQPRPIKALKRNGQWELRLKLRADFPEGTIVDIILQPRILRYSDTKKTLAWDEPENIAIERSALVQRKYAELRVEIPALRNVRVTYRVDPFRQRNGLKLEKPVVVMQDLIRTGSVTGRLKAIEGWYDYTLKMEPQLRKTISQLEKTAEDSNPDRQITRLANKVVKFRELCSRRLEDGTYLGTVGYLDYVSADVITLCSWLMSGEPEKYSPKGGGTPEGGDQEETFESLDDPDGENQSSDTGGDDSPGPGLKDKGSGDIRSESFTRLGKLLDVIADLHRAESFILLLVEAREMVETAWEEKKVDAKSVFQFRKSLGFVAEKLGDERLPVLTMGLLQRTRAMLEKAAGGLLPSEEDVKALIEALEAEERKVSKVAG